MLNKTVSFYLFLLIASSFLPLNGALFAQTAPASSQYPQKVLKGHTDVITSLLFSPDGKLLASTSLDKTARIWEASSGKCLAVLKEHTAGILCQAFSSDSSLLVTGGLDGVINVWKLKDFSLESQLKGHTNHIHSLAISPDNNKIASNSCDGSVRVWNISDEKELFSIPYGNEVQSAIAFVENGEQFIRYYYPKKDGEAVIGFFSSENGELLRTLEMRHDVNSFASAAKPGQIWLLAWKHAILIDLESGKVLSTIKHGRFFPGGLSNTPLIAIGGQFEFKVIDRTKQFFDTPLATARDRTESIQAIAINPQATHAAWGGGGKGYLNFHTQELNQAADCAIRLIDLEAVKSFNQSLQKTAFGTHGTKGGVVITFDPSGNYFASRSENTIRVWDTKKRTGTEPFQLPGKKPPQIRDLLIDKSSMLVVPDYAAKTTFQIYDLEKKEFTKSKTLEGHINVYAFGSDSILLGPSDADLKLVPMDDTPAIPIDLSPYIDKRTPNTFLSAGSTVLRQVKDGWAVIDLATRKYTIQPAYSHGSGWESTARVLSSNGQTLVYKSRKIGEKKAILTLVDVRTWKPTATIPIPADESAEIVAISDDNKQALWRESDKLYYSSIPFTKLTLIEVAGTPRLVHRNPNARQIITVTDNTILQVLTIP